MKTEILATIGPATIDRIEELEQQGLSGIRINSSHGSMESHLEMIQRARQTLPAGYIVYDIKGPKIRIGDLPEPLALKANKTITLRTDLPEAEDSEFPKIADFEQGIPITYKDLDKKIKPGHRLFVDDGYIGLKVDKVEPGKIHCRVLYGDLLRSRKGLNHPDTQVDYPYTMPADLPNLEFAIRHKVDYIADSFTRSGEDVLELRQRLNGTGTGIISKIENPEGVDHFDEILKLTDAIMVARGDLGVEVDPWKLPELQKQMIEKCKKAGKPVITATQMLESMISNPYPSRADVSDVANALYDGSDVIMLSGETSIGHYPVKCVSMMQRIIDYIESTDRYCQKNFHHHTLKKTD